MEAALHGHTVEMSKMYLGRGKRKAGDQTPIEDRAKIRRTVCCDDDM